MYDDYTRTIRPYRSSIPDTARQDIKPRHAQRVPLRGGTRLKWRGRPPRFGKWYTIYKRMNRWARNGVLDRILKGLAQEGAINLDTEAVGIDSTIVKVHPDGTGTPQKGGPQSIGKSRGGWTTKIDIVARPRPDSDNGIL